MRHPKLNAVRYYRISTETIFGLNVYVHNMRCFFYNTLATRFLGPDVSLGFNISDPNVALTHSTFQNGNLNLYCQKYSENYVKHVLICNKKSCIYK